VDFAGRVDDKDAADSVGNVDNACRLRRGDVSRLTKSVDRQLTDQLQRTSGVVEVDVRGLCAYDVEMSIQYGQTGNAPVARHGPHQHRLLHVRVRRICPIIRAALTGKHDTLVRTAPGWQGAPDGQRAKN